MNCPNCNYPLEENQMVCPGCGERIDYIDEGSVFKNEPSRMDFETPAPNEIIDLMKQSPETYREFLEHKLVIAQKVGFDCDITNPNLFPHAQIVTRWALSVGRALIAASFGMTKTRIQCELANQVHARTGKKFLIVCPLGVRHQFVNEDGPVMGQTWQYVRDDNEVQCATSPFLITNYERVRDGNINIAKHDFGGVSLDEGAVLQSLGSKTYSVFKEIFRDIPFRFVATATPDPNDFTGLLGHAEFLGIMDRGQALTRFFKRDTTHAGHLTLHPLHAEEFWMWVASWAMFIDKPSDLGFPDDGYTLPKLNVYWHRLDADQTRAWKQIDNFGQHRLLLNPAAGVREASAEKRETLDQRIAMTLQILKDNPGKHFVLWHHQEIERHALEKSIPGLATIYGSQSDLNEREKILTQFMRGEIPLIALKPQMYGAGCNLQRHCSDMIFVGIDYKFRDTIQAIHRLYRFLQTNEVNVHFIHSDSEDEIRKVFEKKWAMHNEQRKIMSDIIKQYGLSHEALKKNLTRTIGVERVENKQTLFTAINNDCVAEIKSMADNSIDLIHTSIPFGNHYSYTASVEDFGHNLSDDDFWKQMDYLIPELYRVLKPGRIAAIHVKDRILYGWQNKSGILEVEPFSDDCARAFRRYGFAAEGRCTITTDVVRENNSTYRLGWTENSKDSTKMGFGLPEYLLVFRKPPSDNNDARADEPVTKDKKVYTRARWQIDAHAFWKSNGDRPMLPDEMYDYEAHVGRLQAKDDNNNLPAAFFLEPPVSESTWVWDDVNAMLCLNAEQTKKGEQNHICPLPFDIVQRVITRWSNPGELVLDPFAGLFTVPYMAMKLGRKAIGIELKKEYYQAGLRYCNEMEQQMLTPTLFDWLEIKKEQVAK